MSVGPFKISTLYAHINAEYYVLAATKAYIYTEGIETNILYSLYDTHMDALTGDSYCSSIRSQNVGCDVFFVRGSD